MQGVPGSLVGSSALFCAYRFYDGSKDISHATSAADHIPKADLFVIPAESHLMWFSSYNEIIEEKMRTFLLTSQVSG